MVYIFIKVNVTIKDNLAYLFILTLLVLPDDLKFVLLLAPDVGCSAATVVWALPEKLMQGHVHIKGTEDSPVLSDVVSDYTCNPQSTTTHTMPYLFQLYKGNTCIHR